MISLDLSLVREKDGIRAQLAQQMAEFEQKNGVLQTIPMDARCPDIDTAFNNRTQAGRRTELNKSLEERVAEAGPTLSRMQAAERFHLSIADLNAIADRYGFKFKRGYTTNEGYRSEDAKLVERITAMRDVGLNRAQVMRQMEMSYQKFHRLLAEYDIQFKKASSGGYAGRAKA